MALVLVTVVHVHETGKFQSDLHIRLLGPTVSSVRFCTDLLLFKECLNAKSKHRRATGVAARFDLSAYWQGTDADAG